MTINALCYFESCFMSWYLKPVVIESIHTKCSYYLNIR